MSPAQQHQILQAKSGDRASLLGNIAIARGALEAGVQFFSCYPGTPASEIGDTIAQVAQQADITFEYSVNEKVSVEIAFAASLTGARAMCSMKHLGLNYACDPVSTMPYVGVVGGLVIVSAGDPSAITSPNEQDQRWFNRFLYYPIFDPATPSDCLEMTRYAFELSEKTRLPMLMRPTARICHSGGMVQFGSLPTKKNTIKFVKDPQRYVPIPVNARRMRKELTDRFQEARNLLDSSGFFPRTGNGRYGVLASGVAYAYARQAIEDLDLTERVTLQQIGAYPVPDRILLDFLEQVESVLVVEELTPFVEELVSLCAFRNGKQIPIFGKNTGHLPLEFEYSPDLVEDAVRRFVGLGEREVVSVKVPELPPRPPVLCPGCPHRASFCAVRKVFGKRTVYCNDIGCYTLGYGEPLHSCDMLLCMGSSISQASGVARMTGERTVAYIGDSTFFHSGLPGIANAVQAGDDITVVVLDNYITAMTGFQPSLTTDTSKSRSARVGEDENEPDVGPQFSLEAALRGLGVTQIHSVDPFDEEASLACLKEAKNGRGVNAVVFHSPCVVNARRSVGFKEQAEYAIDPERCDACSLCVRMIGCPGLLVTDGQYVIDQDLCTGCGLCAGVCNHDAIHQAPSRGAISVNG